METFPVVIIKWPHGLENPPLIYPNTGSEGQDDAIRALLEQALGIEHGK